MMNGECLIQCELYVGNLLLREFLLARGPDSKSLNSVALYGSNQNEAATGALVSSLLEVNSANVTGMSALTTSSKAMVEKGALSNTVWYLWLSQQCCWRFKSSQVCHCGTGREGL